MKITPEQAEEHFKFLKLWLTDGISEIQRHYIKKRLKEIEEANKPLELQICVSCGNRASSISHSHDIRMKSPCSLPDIRTFVEKK